MCNIKHEVVHTQCMQSLAQQLLENPQSDPHRFLLRKNIPASALSSAMCLTIPLKLKNIFILCAPGGWMETPLACVVCVSGEAALGLCAFPCAQPLHISAHYSPGETSSERHRCPHRHLRCFPMPAVTSHSLASLTQGRVSHRLLFFFFSSLICKAFCGCLVY